MMLFTPEQKTFFMSIYKKMRMADAAAEMNRRFGTSFTYQQIKSWTGNHHLQNGIDCRFPKGHMPANKGTHCCAPACAKTWFQKGHMPENHETIGSEAVTKDGYIKVKVAEPKTWKLKHRLVWEKAHGPVPEGMCVIMADGNRRNCELSNLRLVSRADHAVMNHCHLRTNRPEETDTAVLMAKVMHAQSCRKNKMKGSAKHI
jgi:hypothetical protein